MSDFNERKRGTARYHTQQIYVDYALLFDSVSERGTQIHPRRTKGLRYFNE